MADVLDGAVETSDRQVSNTLGIFAMFPFVLCVEMSASTGQSYRWPPLPCEIIKEEKYSLDYSDVLANGGDLRFFVSRQWMNEEVSRELRVGMVALGVFLLIFLIGSGILFRQLELLRLATTDDLTGIPNRRAFFLKAQGLLQKYPESVYFIQIDLDHFKTINDTHGHVVGDQVLELVGKLLRGSVRNANGRETVLVARLGGDEFGIALHTNNLQGAHTVAKRLCALLQSSEVETGAEVLTVTGSFGLAEIVRGETLDDLYHRADQACYQAKNMGRNQVVVATAPAITLAVNQ
jgi:diguanylate cyclase (GGDEF)-like protein